MKKTLAWILWGMDLTINKLSSTLICLQRLYCSCQISFAGWSLVMDLFHLPINQFLRTITCHFLLWSQERRKIQERREFINCVKAPVTWKHLIVQGDGWKLCTVMDWLERCLSEMERHHAACLPGNCKMQKCLLTRGQKLKTLPCHTLQICKLSVKFIVIY